jgi:hypothetical protein
VVPRKNRNEFEVSTYVETGANWATSRSSLETPEQRSTISGQVLLKEGNSGHAERHSLPTPVFPARAGIQ